MRRYTQESNTSSSGYATDIEVHHDPASPSALLLPAVAAG
jgi:hypothetical protein